MTGGTGTIGRHVVAALTARGHEVRALSRHAERYAVDLRTGAGLPAALAGVDVVVDASNASSSTADARATLVDGTRQLLAAEHDAGVRHHVLVSIVGCHDVPMAYYGVKVEQERAVAAGAVPWTVVAVTQFHEFVTGTLAGAARRGVVPLLRALVQPVAARDAASAVADAAERQPLRGTTTVAGPEVLDLRDAARAWRAATGSRAVPVRVPLPGKLGRALRAGGLTDPRPDARGTTTFRDWLAAQPAATAAR
ncbi:SDR family oxidoreductase [Cellulosimicrobium sp. 22601]|uniref:SDR family oxidoreductase n=1 Tax=unclassified Cellulosimicrobium TaxID=2624466 RepID=UPI003F829CCA